MLDDWTDYFVVGLILIVVLFCICWGICEYNFSQLPVDKVRCELLETSYSPSTQRVQAVPIISSNGSTSVAVYNHGNPESKTTIWKCGKYGRLVSKDSKLFQYSKDVMILWIRDSSYDTRIVGWER